MRLNRQYMYFELFFKSISYHKTALMSILSQKCVFEACDVCVNIPGTMVVFFPWNCAGIGTPECRSTEINYNIFSRCLWNIYLHMISATHMVHDTVCNITTFAIVDLQIVFIYFSEQPRPIGYFIVSKSVYVVMLIHWNEIMIPSLCIDSHDITINWRNIAYGKVITFYCPVWLLAAITWWRHQMETFSA